MKKKLRRVRAVLAISAQCWMIALLLIVGKATAVDDTFRLGGNWSLEDFGDTSLNSQVVGKVRGNLTESGGIRLELSEHR
jgi:hypothetical protein